jgi:ribosomal protein S18 acetylase RimI-like enzyme
MRPSEWETFEARAMSGYARTLATPDGSSSSAARRRAEAEHAALLPDGINSPNHFFYVIEAPDGKRVGTIWFAEQVEDATRYAYLYDIEVDESARGAGVGEAAMLALEAEARGRGLAWIDLNVAGSNEIARGLYRKLAYQETFVRMRKSM